jgi:hypothetical protein
VLFRIFLVPVLEYFRAGFMVLFRRFRLVGKRAPSAALRHGGLIG